MTKAFQPSQYLTSLMLLLLSLSLLVLSPTTFSFSFDCYFPASTTSTRGTFINTFTARVSTRHSLLSSQSILFASINENETINENKNKNKNKNEKGSKKSSTNNKMMKYGILISSFTDGILKNNSINSNSINNSNSNSINNSKLFFQHSLASILMKEYITQIQTEIESSVKYSPCAGPNIDLLNLLEEGDIMLQRIHDSLASITSLSTTSSSFSSSKTQYENENKNTILRDVIQYMTTIQSTMIPSSSSTSTSTSISPFNPPTIRILYIPTAMYALRADSKNSPGKQRQRARADGKKRRNQLVQFVEKLFQQEEEEEEDDDNDDSLLHTLAVTLDLDDGSIKQPTAKGYRFDDNDDDDDNNNNILFPINGKEALTTWKPHIICVEGGNTFWLQHCIEKGDEDWSQLLQDACTSSTNQPALYIGKSAGAIIAGKFVETATWKGWDDPSVVPGRETYEDWKGHIGLNLVNDASFFPHMSTDYEDLVEERSVDLNHRIRGDGSTDDNDIGYCDHKLHVLREEDSYLVFDESNLIES